MKPAQERFLPDLVAKIEGHISTSSSTHWLQTQNALLSEGTLFRFLPNAAKYGNEIVNTTPVAQETGKFTLSLSRKLDTDAISIDNIAIPVRGEGLGTEIVDLIKSEAQSHGIHKIIAHNLVPSIKVIKFWKSQGFVPNKNFTDAEYLIPQSE